MGQQREHNRWLLDWVLGKKRQMGLCLWKSLLCLRRANMREWVIALFCCGTLGSDERRVPVVKTAKDQVFHRWREGKTSTEKWLRSPATLMLATAQEVIWFSEGQSTQQHPLGDSDIWKITFLNCWFWSLTLKLPVLQISVLLVACVVLCCAWTERQQKCREGCPGIQQLLREQTMVFSMKMPFIPRKSAWQNTYILSCNMTTVCLSLVSLVARQQPYVYREPVLALSEETWLKS